VNTERYHRVKKLFEVLSEMPKEQQAAYLEAHCDDEKLREQVNELLRHDQNPIDLPEPVIGREQLEEAWDGHTPLPEVPGFTVLSLLGEGGMGEVYLAEQDFPRRQVALKLVRGARFSPQAIRRFREEIQLLGRLHHPGITQVFAADPAHTKPGVRPYFAMEYIEGLPLVEYAQKKKLSTQERLKLLIKVAEAAHYAHQEGIIHRDLKPANILVDQTGQPKILDFGIARAVGDDFETRTLLTASEHVVGTMGYMAPEQFRGMASQIGPQVDVYALGVMLFELLTGELPHPLTGLNLFEAGKRITEGEPMRIGTLQRLHRGDLDTLVSKALQREPDQRFASAQDLADDLKRYLQGSPIQARSPSWTYRGRKFLVRQRVRLGLVVSALAVGVAGMAWYGPPLSIPEVEAFDWSFEDFLLGKEVQFQFIGTVRDGRFGSSIAAPGDLNGDQVGDLLVGAPQEAVSGTKFGSITAISGATGETLHKWYGGTPDAQFGHALQEAGDLDGDLVADFWTMTGDLDHQQYGELVAYSGATWKPIRSYTGAQLGYCLMRRMTTVGDLTGDGLEDLAIACEAIQPGDQHQRQNGLVVIFSASDASVIRVLDTGVPMRPMVHRIANAGDVDADGVPDLIVGTFQAKINYPGQGQATVYSGADGSILHQWRGSEAQIQLGFAVASAGDVDLDGHSDLLVSALHASFTGVKTGRVYLYSGKDGHLIRDLDGLYSNARFGADLCSIGDINGDGVPDQAIGAWVATQARVFAGAVHVYSGLDGKRVGSWYGDRESARLGFPLQLVPDLNGDGLPELAAGAANNMKMDVQAGSVRLISSLAFHPEE
jgi:predicted Ser/Thr protein kinase